MLSMHLLLLQSVRLQIPEFNAVQFENISIDGLQQTGQSVCGDIDYGQIRQSTHYTGSPKMGA